MPAFHYRPYLINITLLFITIILSVAIGSVYIPPLTFVRILIAQVPGILLDPKWPETFSTIVLQIRLPHTLLVLVTGSALAGSVRIYFMIRDLQTTCFIIRDREFPDL